MIEDYYKWENMSLSNLQWLMVKWFDFDKVNTELMGRMAVESGVWYRIEMEYRGKQMRIDGQRPDIVKRRLIELLDSLEIRPKEFIPKEEKD